MTESHQIYSIRTRLDKITPVETIDAFWHAGYDWEQLNPTERNLLQQTVQSLEAYLNARGIDYPDVRTRLFEEHKKRYDSVFVPISHRALERELAGTILPIYYAKPTEGNITRLFYIHIGGTNDIDLQTYVTDKLVKSARIKRVTQSGNFVFVQSNMARSPTEIEEDKILKSLGLQPQVIALDYLTKAKV